MKPVTPNIAIWFAVMGFTAYWVLASVISASILKDVFDSLALGVAVTIVITWYGAAWRAVKEGATAGEWQLVIAVFLLWFVLVMQRIYSILVAYYDRPEWITNTAFAGFMPYSITLAGILFLTAAGIVDEARPHRYLWHIVFAVGIGSLVAGVLVGMSMSNLDVLPPLG